MSLATARPSRPQGTIRHRQVNPDGSVTITKIVTDARGVTRRHKPVTVVPCDAHK